MDNMPTDFMFRMLGEELSTGIEYKFVHGPRRHDWVGPSSAFTELFGRNLGDADAMRFEGGSSVLRVVGKHGTAEGGDAVTVRYSMRVPGRLLFVFAGLQKLGPATTASDGTVSRLTLWNSAIDEAATRANMRAGHMRE
eukprot:3931939-Rhodomonas_salina.1